MSGAELSPFHLAIVVSDLARAREFYGDVLGCNEGRSSNSWVDFDFFGHQLVCHLGPAATESIANPVDGDHVPVPHFGVVLSLTDWEVLAGRIETAGVPFQLAPKLRFAGQPGEQGTFFIFDPFGNALEFKGFRDRSSLFAPNG